MDLHNKKGIRWISAAALLAFFIPVFYIVYNFKISGLITGISVYGILTMICGFEISRAFKFKKHTIIIVSILMLGSFFLPYDNFMTIVEDARNGAIKESTEIMYYFDLLFGWQTVAAALIISFIPSLIDPTVWAKETKKAFFDQFMFTLTIMGMVFLSKGFWFMNMFNIWWLITFVTIPILADTGGYLGGKYIAKYVFNRAKLAPELSPKKTWGGFITGWVVALSFALPMLMWQDIFAGDIDNHAIRVTLYVIIAIVLPPLSAMGDLYFSFVKRTYDIKDFSKLIPGHGGVMDRFDSILFVFNALIIIFSIAQNF